MTRNDWRACKDSVRELVRTTGLRPYPIVSAYAACNEGERLQQGRMPNFDDARAVFDAAAQRIAEAQYDPSELQAARGSVLTTSEWLNKNGFLSLAQDLRSQLDRATVRTQQVQALPPASPPAQVSQGTCFAVTPDGGVLTAYHVVENSNEIWVSFAPGQKEKAVIEQSAKAVDVALLRINRQIASYLSLVSTRSITTGQPVFTVGFPATQVLGMEPKFTDGAVSALSGLMGEASFLQITVPIQPQFLASLCVSVIPL